MHYMTRKIWNFIAALTLTMSGVANVHAVEQVGNQVDAQAISKGAKAWANNCMRCHNARDPNDYRDDQWKVIMSHMRMRAGLTGQEASDVLKFLQGSKTRTSPAPTRKSETVASTALVAASGKSLYEGTCVACHGADGAGSIPGVPALSAAAGRLTQSDDILKQHILDGFQTPGSPMAMPAKGGNPNLTEPDVAKLLSYMRATFGR